jgi:hypothetical protein
MISGSTADPGPITKSAVGLRRVSDEPTAWWDRSTSAVAVTVGSFVP